MTSGTKDDYVNLSIPMANVFRDRRKAHDKAIEAAEREACAKVAASYPQGTADAIMTGLEIAAAIRARGKP